MQKRKGNSSGLAELAKEKSLDAADSKIFCCARDASEKAEFVQCENQRIICGCDKHVLMIRMSFWNHVTWTLEELLSTFQMRFFFFSFFAYIPPHEKMQHANCKGESSNRLQEKTRCRELEQKAGSSMNKMPQHHYIHGHPNRIQSHVICSLCLLSVLPNNSSVRIFPVVFPFTHS